MEHPIRPSSPSALVVDDEELLRKAAAGILEDAGFVIIEAAHADAALQILEQHDSIVLLFTDVQMPGSRDGFALAREVARRWPHITIVVTSGQEHPGTVALPKDARFISKPFRAQVVHRQLREAMPDERKPALLKSLIL